MAELLKEKSRLHLKTMQYSDLLERFSASATEFEESNRDAAPKCYRGVKDISAGHRGESR
jgi:hypothetical protein